MVVFCRSALSLLRRAGGRGHPEALHNLGVAYMQGVGVARDEMEENEREREAEDEDMPSAIEGFAGGFLPSVAGSMIEGGLISGVANSASKSGADRSKFASTRREEVDGDFPADELPSGIEPLSSFRERQQPRDQVTS